VDPDPAAPHPFVRVADAAILVAIFGVSALLVFGPRLGQTPEDQDRVLRVVAAALCLLYGIVLLQVRGLRRQILVMEDLLQDVRFGAGTKRDRDAVDILVTALRAPDGRARETALRTLRKLSGVDLGPDPAAWEEWWRAARGTFTRPASAGPAGAPAGRK
jgi:hypothetical protein